MTTPESLLLGLLARQPLLGYDLTAHYFCNTAPVDNRPIT